MSDVKIESSWRELLAGEFEKSYFKELTNFVREEYKSQTVYPPAANVFRAFNCCPVDKLKVIIIGQDPYHNEGQANGLCFSVAAETQFPPSLKNILKEVSDDTGASYPTSGELDRWAKQGVLMLNAVLTVQAHSAASHAGRGWETFTDAVVRAVAEHRKDVVYMLWGAYAQKKATVVNANENKVLIAPHPSPLSSYRGFFGCKHFSRANEYLVSVGQEPIVW